MADDDRPRIDTTDRSIRITAGDEAARIWEIHAREGFAGVRRALAPVPDPPKRPKPVPSPALRAVVEALVELLAKEHRHEFNRIDPSGELRKSYEYFRCDLSRAGFRVDHLSRQRRAQHFRSIGEQLEASGHPAAAADFYEWAVASWKPIGCAARAKQLRRMLERR